MAFESKKTRAERRAEWKKRALARQSTVSEGGRNNDWNLYNPAFSPSSPSFSPSSPSFSPLSPLHLGFGGSLATAAVRTGKRERKGFTANGAVSLPTTSNPLVDFYFRMVPGMEESEAMSLAERAASKDLLGLLRLTYDLRNCRGGKGRRQLFHWVGMQLLASPSVEQQEAWLHNLHHLPHFGYFKDLWAHWEYCLQLSQSADRQLPTSTSSSSSCSSSSSSSGTIEDELMKRLQEKVVEIYAKQLDADCQAVFGMSCHDYHLQGNRCPPEVAEKKDSSSVELKDDGEPCSSSSSSSSSTTSEEEVAATKVATKKQVSCSLAAKYAPTPSKHFDKSLGGACHALYKALGMNERSYRWLISELRSRLQVLERKMSSGEWGSIEFSKTPSVALMRNSKVLERHEPERWQEFRAKVESGKEKINVGQLAPYELVQNLLSQGPDANMELMLAEYIRQHSPKMQDVVIVADTSGSMTSSPRGKGPRPIDVCMSLTLIAATANKGTLHNRYFAFSDRSEEVTLEGETYWQKLQHMKKGPWGMNTNLQAVFKAIREKMLAKTDPTVRAIIVISDMQFDSCGAQHTNFEKIDREFQQVGLTRPKLVFWNVSALGDDYPVCSHKSGTILVSGCSPALFQMVVDAPDNITPWGFVQSVLDDPRYARIQLPPSIAVSEPALP